MAFCCLWRPFFNGKQKIEEKENEEEDNTVQIVRNESVNESDDENGGFSLTDSDSLFSSDDEDIPIEVKMRQAYQRGKYPQLKLLFDLLSDSSAEDLCQQLDRIPESENEENEEDEEESEHEETEENQKLHENSIQKLETK